MKKWGKPLMTVLCRARNEEAVLTTCKAGPTGPQGANGQCSNASGNPTNPACGYDCSAYAGS